MVARYDTVCPACKDVILAGDRIRYDAGRRAFIHWGHGRRTVAYAGAAAYNPRAQAQREAARAALGLSQEECCGACGGAGAGWRREVSGVSLLVCRECRTRYPVVTEEE